MLPLPSSEATVESVEHGGAGYNVVLLLVGETEEVRIQTRWKERDGRPTVIEAGHLSKTVREPVGGDVEGEAEDDGSENG